MTRLGRFLDSATAQAIGVVLAISLGVALHWANDGLWFRGDAARHAATGVFFWDLLTEAPTRPIEYATSYYARYPVIVPGAYLPLFHLIEGPVFRVLGASPYVAKGLVWTFAAFAAVYVMLWGRHLIARWAGWAGPLVLLLPGFVRYSNVVMPNIPSAALCLAALYHLQRWLDAGSASHRRWSLMFAVAAVTMYIPAAVVILVAAAWALLAIRRVRLWSLWVPAAVVLVIVLVTAAALPGHMARQAPSLLGAFSVAPWAFYARELPFILGFFWPALAALGLVVALVRSASRPQGIRLLAAAAAIMAGLTSLPARDERYALLLGPLCVLAACLGLTAVADVVGRWRNVVLACALASMFAIATVDAARTRVPHVSGFEQIARYLVERAPTDSVLYSGGDGWDGIFTFYVRALDPEFDRRVVLSRKLLYRYQQGPDFRWTETPFVRSSAEVAELIKTQSGCRWIAVEELPESRLGTSERLLREALASPDFELVASFPVMAGIVREVDLYRVRGQVEPVHAMDVSFPSFSNRVFRNVLPVERHR